jgi:hypothetical protein
MAMGPCRLRLRDHRIEIGLFNDPEGHLVGVVKTTPES